MEFKDGEFDCVIDKGTMDALLVSSIDDGRVYYLMRLFREFSLF